MTARTQALPVPVLLLCQGGAREDPWGRRDETPPRRRRSKACASSLSSIVCRIYFVEQLHDVLNVCAPGC